MGIMTNIKSKAGIENQDKIIEKKTYLFIANLSDEQVDEITSMINTSFERYDGAYDNCALVCDRGIKFGGY
jgi:galactose-1-phosphate uridylyltransferase